MMMKSYYAQRRAEFARAIGDAVAVIPAARHAIRNADTEYEYRQNSDFFYLTGFTEPQAVLVLAPGRDSEQSTVFLRGRDAAAEIWTGRRLGVEAAADNLGVGSAYPIEELSARLPDLLTGARALYYALGFDEVMDREIIAAVKAAQHKVRRGGIAPRSFIEPGTVLHEMRLHKSPEELEIMRRAAAASRAGHEAGMRATRPDMWEYELEALMEYEYTVAGAQAVAYPSIVAGGANATVLHYNINRGRLSSAELVLVDSGAEVDHYASDVTRTWPVDGRFSPEQRALYEIVLRAQLAGIDAVRPGRPIDEYHRTAVRILTEGLVDVGLLGGGVDELITTEAYAAFYPHRTGHYIGIDVHDAGSYTQEKMTYRPLEPGMVVTVEPGLYIQPDADVPERWKGIGIRIEDDILCTSDAPENLTAAIPKDVETLEALVGSQVLVRS